MYKGCWLNLGNYTDLWCYQLSLRLTWPRFTIPCRLAILVAFSWSPFGKWTAQVFVNLFEVFRPDEQRNLTETNTINNWPAMSVSLIFSSLLICLVSDYFCLFRTHRRPKFYLFQPLQSMETELMSCKCFARGRNFSLWRHKLRISFTANCSRRCRFRNFRFKNTNFLFFNLNSRTIGN